MFLTQFTTNSYKSMLLIFIAKAIQLMSVTYNNHRHHHRTTKKPTTEIPSGAVNSFIKSYQGETSIKIYYQLQFPFLWQLLNIKDISRQVRLTVLYVYVCRWNIMFYDIECNCWQYFVFIILLYVTTKRTILIRTRFHTNRGYLELISCHSIRSIFVSIFITDLLWLCDL